MQIEPIQCSKCRHIARPGEIGFSVVIDGAGVKIHCDCGNIIGLTSFQEQFILSNNSFVRLRSASNYSEYGEASLLPGLAKEIRFQEVFDFPCKAFITSQNASAMLLVKEMELRKDGMIIISSFLGDKPSDITEVNFSWIVFGLREIDNLETWYIHFYSAITHLENGLFKAALLDYAVAFETFLESYLMTRLSNQYSVQIAEYLLKRSWRIDERCKDLLELATKQRLSEQKDLYNSWDKYVRQPRNALAHGKRLTIDQAHAEKAHQIVYQTIKWIENLP